MGDVKAKDIVNNEDNAPRISIPSPYREFQYEAACRVPILLAW